MGPSSLWLSSLEPGGNLYEKVKVILEDILIVTVVRFWFL